MIRTLCAGSVAPNAARRDVRPEWCAPLLLDNWHYQALWGATRVCRQFGLVAPAGHGAPGRCSRGRPRADVTRVQLVARRTDRRAVAARAEERIPAQPRRL